MIEYPKIQTLYDRDERHKVDPTRLRLTEFDLIREWYVTEKIDGTNIRVHWQPGHQVAFAGRTDAAQIPGHLLEYLRETFTDDKMATVFPDTKVTLFGEGFGPKIQNGHTYGMDEPSFALFDIHINGWWLEPDNISDVAKRLNIRTVPLITKRLICNEQDLRIDLNILADLTQYRLKPAQSQMAAWHGAEREPEGIVARTVPMLFTRKGERLMWKLKFKDFS